MKKYSEYSKEMLNAELKVLTEQYKGFQEKKLKLDMSRGKPGADQLELTQDMLGVISNPLDCMTEDNFDCRNYGILDGIAEAKRIFAEILEVPAKNIIVAGNSSLNLMYDEISRAMLYGVVGSERPWSKLEKVKFLCPSPGYDRHFAICEKLGIEMITVPMLSDGPDMDMIDSLVAGDDSIKGVWCVPKFSNPDGIVFSDEVVRRFASLKPAAKDFRIFWDNAYVIHGLYDVFVPQLNLFTEAAKYGNQNMPVIFTSTSKISFPGSGVAVMAASDANISKTKDSLSIQTIGYDKINQMRHVKYFKSASGIAAHMEKHAAILRPKFETVLNALEELRPLDICSWVKPAGGYFISLNVMEGCAQRVFTLTKEAGVTMTNAGATYPYGKDPLDRNLRIAPTFPSLKDLGAATGILCLCVKIASLEKLLRTVS